MDRTAFATKESGLCGLLLGNSAIIAGHNAATPQFLAA
jgi:hypothetical protein